MSWLENRIPPPFVVLIIGVAMWGLAVLTPRWSFAGPWRFGLSALMFVLAVVVGGLGLSAFRNARTTIDPVNLNAASALVTTGIFQYSRNPMYLGFAGLLAAWATFLAAPWALIGVPAFVGFVWRFQILPEERAMGEKYGQDYAEYRHRVRRWL